MLMTKGLMERSLHHEMTLRRVREKAKLAEEELFELRNWKVVTEQKLKLAKRARDEYQKMKEELKKVLEDKENDLRMPKKQPFWNIMTPMPYCQSSEFQIMTVSMTQSVKPRPYTQSLTFHPSTSPSRRLLLFTLSSQMIRMSFLGRKCPSLSPLRSRRLKKEKPMKQKTPLLLMFNKFLFILFKYFENNLVLPVVYRVKLYPFCRHFILFI